MHPTTPAAISPPFEPPCRKCVCESCMVCQRVMSTRLQAWPRKRKQGQVHKSQHTARHTAHHTARHTTQHGTRHTTAQHTAQITTHSIAQHQLTPPPEFEGVVVEPRMTRAGEAVVVVLVASGRHHSGQESSMPSERMRQPWQAKQPPVASQYWRPAKQSSCDEHITPSPSVLGQTGQAPVMESRYTTQVVHG